MGKNQDRCGHISNREIEIGDGERRIRYILVRNPLEAERQKRLREKALEELRAELRGKPSAKRVCELAQLLSRYGCVVTRQAGSHLRLTTTERGEHHLTVPNHDPSKIGTLDGIPSEVADHFRISKDKVMRDLFG